MLPQKDTGGGKPLQKLLFRRLRTFSRRARRWPRARRCWLCATGCPSGIGMPSIIEAAGTGERAGHALVGATRHKRSLVDSAMQSWRCRTNYVLIPADGHPSSPAIGPIARGPRSLPVLHVAAEQTGDAVQILLGCERDFDGAAFFCAVDVHRGAETAA